MNRCPICKENSQQISPVSRGDYSVKCPRCGNYHLTEPLLFYFQHSRLSDRQRANISSWLFENKISKITTRNIDWLRNIPSPSFHERADKILLGFEKLTEFAGQYLQFDTSWLSIGWCINAKEVDEVLQYLEASSRIHKQTKDNQPIYKILPNGWSQLEALKKTGADSKQCFVAMWFDDQMQSIFDESIARGILDAGYKPHRVDQREYNDKIDDEIIAQIRRSRFVVADFTGHRGGTYYEAGFAKGLGLEVIWTCRKDDMRNLHFDIRQYNCIDWEIDKLEDFRLRLKNRIERVFGRGIYQVQEG